MAHEKNAHFVLNHTVLVDYDDDWDVGVLENFTDLLWVACRNKSYLDIYLRYLILCTDQIIQSWLVKFIYNPCTKFLEL